jgi:hypothetical protein
MGLPISNVMMRPNSAFSFSRISAAASSSFFRSANDVRRHERYVSAARASFRSISASASGGNVRSVSPVAGLMDVIAMA